MPFRINLATRTYVNVAAVNLGIICSVVILAGWLVTNLLTVTQNLYEIKRLKSEEQAPVSSEKVGRQFTAREIKEIGERVKYVNDIYKAGTTAWLTLLNNLEAVTPDGVAIKSINKGKDGEIKLTGTAKNFKVVTTFIDRTNDSKLFRDVYLVSQGSTKFGKKQTGTTFTITCKALN